MIKQIGYIISRILHNKNLLSRSNFFNLVIKVDYIPICWLANERRGCFWLSITHRLVLKRLIRNKYLNYYGGTNRVLVKFIVLVSKYKRCHKSKYLIFKKYVKNIEDMMI